MITREKLQQWEERVNALQMRERLLLLFTLIALTYGLFDLLLLSPLHLRMQQTEQSQVDVHSQLAVLEQQSRDFSKTQDPLAAEKQQRDQLQQTLAQAQQQLENRMGNLLSRDEAPQLLYELIDHQRNLRLVKLATNTTSFANNSSTDVMATGFNRFNLELDLQGSYLDTLRFVQSMENTDWQLFWDSLELNIVDHPSANIHLTLYTLGTGI